MKSKIFSGIFKLIRNSFFRIVNKEFLIFLFFLALSSVFWVMSALNDTYDYELKYPIRLINVPKNIVITDTNTDTLRITVRDKGYYLTQYIFDQSQEVIEIPYAQYAKRNGSGQVSNAELTKMVSRDLENSTKIVSMKPEKFEFYYSYGTHKKLPVKLAGSVTPDVSYYLTKIEFSPKTVDVYGSQKMLDSLKCVYTERVSMHNLRDTIVKTVTLANVKGIKCIPSQVRMTIYPDVLTEESFDVPIVAQNMPDGKVLRTFPSRVKVIFTVGAGEFRSIRADMFKVVVDYEDLLAAPSEKCSLKIVSMPHGVRNVHTDVTQVDYLIEEQ